MYPCAALTTLPSMLWLGMALMVLHVWTPLSRTASQFIKRTQTESVSTPWEENVSRSAAA